VCGVCGALFYVKASRLAAGKGRFCSRACRRDGFRARSGPDHAQWTGGRWRTRSGYIRVNNGRGGYELEHRLVWQQEHGPIPEELHIHHLDGNKANNVLSNLAVLPNGDHIRAHHRTPKLGRWSKVYDACRECGTTSRHHSGHGYCNACFRRLRRHGRVLH
jgi:hypothetical protein